MFEEIRISDLTPAFIVNSGDLFVIEQADGTRSLSYSLLRNSLSQEIASGKVIELNNNGISLQWKYLGDLVWRNLLNLSELKGPPGDSISWKGTWIDTTLYKLLEAVSYNGSSYICINATGNAGKDPSLLSSRAYWGILGEKGAAGAAGAPGAAGAAGAPGAGIVWKGAYSASASYIKLDAVSYNSQAYICKSETSITQTLPTETSKWDLMAAKGESGTAAVWNYRGAYSSATVYVVGDLVTSAGSLWYRKLIGAAGDAPATGSTYWDVLALKGTDGTGGGTGGDFTYASNIADDVSSGALGGAPAALASVWKTRTVVQVLDLLLFPTQLPTYTVPTLALSGSQSGTKEVGTSLNQSLSLVATKNDAGAFTTLTILKSGASLSSSSSLTAVSATAIATQFGYDNLNNPNFSYTLNYVDNIAVPYSTLTWTGSSVYLAGVTKKDNKNATDSRSFAVRSTAAPQSASSNLTANSVSVTGIYPYFWGKVAAASGKPTAAQIAGFIQAGTSNKVLADASGTLTITFAASSEYVWVAHEASLTNKTKWYNTANNLGNIGAGNFIEAPVQQNVTSPEALWTGVSFDIYISGAATNTSGSYQLQN